MSFSVSDGKLRIYGDGDYKPTESITKVTIYGLEKTIEVDGIEQAKSAFRDNTKVFDIEGVQLPLVGESEICWE